MKETRIQGLKGTGHMECGSVVLAVWQCGGCGLGVEMELAAVLERTHALTSCQMGR